MSLPDSVFGCKIIKYPRNIQLFYHTLAEKNYHGHGTWWEVVSGALSSETVSVMAGRNAMVVD